MLDPVKWMKGWRLDLFFEKLLRKSEQLYDHLSALEQQLSKQVSGIVAIINANLKAMPDFVFDIIVNYFPSITKDKLTGYLGYVNGFIGKIDKYTAGTFQDELKKLQDYLNSYEGNPWIAATKTVLNVLIIAFEPTGTLQKIEAVLEYVYETFYRGKVPVVPAAA